MILWRYYPKTKNGPAINILLLLEFVIQTLIFVITDTCKLLLPLP
jgi:hypothetical protein